MASVAADSWFAPPARTYSVGLLQGIGIGIVLCFVIILLVTFVTTGHGISAQAVFAQGVAFVVSTALLVVFDRRAKRAKGAAA